MISFVSPAAKETSFASDTSSPNPEIITESNLPLRVFVPAPPIKVMLEAVFEVWLFTVSSPSPQSIIESRAAEFKRLNTSFPLPP